MNRVAEMPGELIFVVDDDDAVRASLRALLETAGYRTMQFESGADFLDFPHAGLGACVLLDVKMPGPDGLEAMLRELREEGVLVLRNGVLRLLDPGRLTAIAGDDEYRFASRPSPGAPILRANRQVAALT